MSRLVTYLTFSGNCREAMEFYQGCLGGELMFQTVGDTPGSFNFPQELRNMIVHASLKKGNMILMGTDMRDEELLHGNTVSIFVDCQSEMLIKKYYRNLQIEGEATHPLEETHWGDLFGGLKDKYGNKWLLHYKRNSGFGHWQVCPRSED